MLRFLPSVRATDGQRVGFTVSDSEGITRCHCAGDNTWWWQHHWGVLYPQFAYIWIGLAESVDTWVCISCYIEGIDNCIGIIGTACSTTRQREDTTYSKWWSTCSRSWPTFGSTFGVGETCTIESIRGSTYVIGKFYDIKDTENLFSKSQKRCFLRMQKSSYKKVRPRKCVLQLLLDTWPAIEKE